MAYCRFDGRSDVYMFETGHPGIDCCNCDLARRGLATQTLFTRRTDALAHLQAHRDAGDRVPDWAFEDLTEEIGRLGDMARDVYLVDCGNGRVECRDCFEHYGAVVLESQEALAEHRGYHQRKGELVPEPYALPPRPA